MTVQPASDYADSAFFVLHCCIFVFFSFRPNAPLFFFFGEMCGRIGNEMPRCHLVTKSWVQLDKKRWGRMYPWFSVDMMS